MHSPSNTNGQNEQKAAPTIVAGLSPNETEPSQTEIRDKAAKITQFEVEDRFA